VEEVLRWSTPIIFRVRGARRDVVLGNTPIKKGSRVVTMLRSANRDEDVFDNAFEFDIARQHNPHVTFGGGGAHHCLGAMLARAKIRAALDEILLNTADIGLSEPKIQHPEHHLEHDCLRLTSGHPRTYETTVGLGRYRVVQWATGNVGQRALRAVLDRDVFELVGVHAFSPDKVGRDAGALALSQKSQKSTIRYSSFEAAFETSSTGTSCRAAIPAHTSQNFRNEKRDPRRSEGLSSHASRGVG
jgi:hypothetical protein